MARRINCLVIQSEELALLETCRRVHVKINMCPGIIAVGRKFTLASTPAGHQRVGPFPQPEGVIVYWHVDNVPATYDQLLSMGAKPHEAPRDFGEGFIGASVIDPFGNILGIMYNPHYLEAAGAEQD